MDLTLSRRGDYAVRAAIALARAWEGAGYRKIREIAQDMALPPSFTPEVLGALAAAGLARSKAGPTGGYRLARPPNEISLLEVVEATEGDLFSGRCTLRGGPCRWDDVCAVHPSWIRVREQVRAVMTSLSELAAEDRRLEA